MLAFNRRAVRVLTIIRHATDRFIDWPYLWLLFKNISPYFWAVIGVALCVGTSILGAAW